MSDPATFVVEPGIALFDRRYKLQITDTVITGLNIRFNVKRSLVGKRPGTCDIDIINLAEPTRKRLHGTKQIFCSLEAGYVGGMSVLFRGELLEAWSKREGTEWVTIVSSIDGGTKLKRSRVSATYGPKVPIRDVLIGIAKTLGLGPGNLLQASFSAEIWDKLSNKFAQGFAASGDSAGELDRVMRTAGLEWSVQEGQLQVLALRQALSDAPILLTPRTGLLDSVELGRDQVLRLSTLLAPGLYPGRKIQIKSRYVQGFYRIESTVHQGEFDGGHWTVGIEARAVT